jgi:antitoxin (DNA-binding transcriptional repressor) of toxin-antitoxin stability system
MKEIGAFEAKNRLGALLDRVEQGEEILITRRGKPVASWSRLSPTSIERRLAAPLPDFSRQAEACRCKG